MAQEEECGKVQCQKNRNAGLKSVKGLAKILSGLGGDA
jgi:hypothetical protein